MHPALNPAHPLRKIPTNVSEHVMERIGAYARDKGINPAVVHRRYALDRVLARVATSRFADLFVLKGGLLLGLTTGDGDMLRPTSDADFGISLHLGTAEDLKAALTEILGLDMNDGVVFGIKRVQDTHQHEDDVFAGVKFILEARIGGARVKISVDAALGMMACPEAPAMQELKTLLPNIFPRVQMRCYPLAYACADKIHASYRRRSTGSSTRVKDIFDLAAILPKVTPADLEDALVNVFTDCEQYTKIGPLDECANLSDAWVAEREADWAAFLAEHRLVSGTLSDNVIAVRAMIAGAVAGAVERMAPAYLAQNP
jgi:predicted nucleotidyltransferase component of viral defense system